MLALLIAATVAQPPRDPNLLHRQTEAVSARKDQEQETTLRRMLELGGSAQEQSEILARLAGLLRARGLALGIQSQAEADAGDEAAAAKDKRAAADARAEAISRYRELLKKYPGAPRTDEALFFLADTLQDSGRDPEAVAAARELTRRFPRSQWAPASHVFIGEHLFEEAKLDEALKEYRAAAEVPGDDVYPYALYKAAWCRFNQNRFDDAMKLLKRVVDVSVKSGDVNKVQLAKEARRDYVLAYARIGAPEKARDQFVRLFGAEPGLKMLQQFGKLLFDTGRDAETQLVHRQLLALHGDAAVAALDQTRLLVVAQRTGKRRDLLGEAKALVDVFRRVRATSQDESYAEAQRLGEETLRTLAVQIHNEARKTNLDDTWAAARALYGDYLTLFPDAPDAYDLRFFYGELLYVRGAKSEAAEQYEQVVKMDLAAKRQGKWLGKAAWSAVLARNEALPGGKAEQKDTGQRRAQRPLTADEQKLAQACLLYLTAVPDGPHIVETAFKVGRLEYISGQYEASQEHLSFIALRHPEHELAEYSANLVLDIENLRHDWQGVHRWAVRFLGDRKLTAHGTLLADLRRIEEESAYALADGVEPDAKKAASLLAFVASHPKGLLADKALFGAAAALSRAGRIDDALAARARVWKEAPQSSLVPRALLASAADLAAVAEVGEAAALLEKYGQGFQRQQSAAKRRREHPSRSSRPEPQRALYEEAKAQTALHDAALLREAQGDLARAIADRQLSLQLWKKPADREEQVLALARLRGKLGASARAARELAALARETRSPALQLTAWSEAARSYARAHESGNAQWSWTQVERIYRSLPAKARDKLADEAVAAAADAHFALGGTSFETFRKQQIKAPLMVTLNRKIALLQAVKKRAEETVAMRQAEPAVCALSQLGEAQMMLGQAIAQSPYPPGLNPDQRKLYRAAVVERAQPLYEEAKATLRSAEGKSRDLGVTGSCAARAASLLEKLSAKPGERRELQLAAAPIVGVPEMVDARAEEGERAKRLLSEALGARGKLPEAQVLQKFEVAAQAGGAPSRFDLAVALDQAGRGPEAEQAYRSVAAGKNAIGYEAAARAAALAVARGDAAAARSAMALAADTAPVSARALSAEVELGLGNVAAARDAAKAALMNDPADVGALCAMARAQLAQNAPGVARLLAARAAQADPGDAEPLLVQAEVARASGEPAAELAAVRAAVAADPQSVPAQLALGRAWFERGRTGDAIVALQEARNLDPASYSAALALGEALVASGEIPEAEEALHAAMRLAPKAPEPHLALARLKLDGEGDAQAALQEAKLFLSLSTVRPPPGHPVHALVQRCEEALQKRAQASVVQ